MQVPTHIYTRAQLIAHRGLEKGGLQGDLTAAFSVTEGGPQESWRGAFYKGM